MLDFEEEMNSPLRNILEKQPIEKRPNVFNSKYKKQLVQKILLRRMLCNKNNFCRTLPFWLLKIISLFNLLKAIG
jgi:hypothetical protein